MEKQKRNEKILSLRKRGLTYQNIADLYGISRQRIHQIVQNILSKIQ